MPGMDPASVDLDHDLIGESAIVNVGRASSITRQTGRRRAADFRSRAPGPARRPGGSLSTAERMSVEGDSEEVVPQVGEGSEASPREVSP
jgi:hypothetical protein